MLSRTRIGLAAVLATALLAGSIQAADATFNMKGTPDLKMAGPLAFGPQGILFVGDPQGAAIFAIATGDNKAVASPVGNGAVKVEGIDEKIAARLGTTAKEIKINDLAVNPDSGAVYLSVTRGNGAEALPVLLRVRGGGNIKEVPLKDVRYSKAALPNASGRSRMMSITKIAFVKDRVFVAGLSNEEWASTLRAIPFPFSEVDKGANIQIWHGAHGKFETGSPIQTFVPYEIKGEANILAAYTCTPLVKLPVAALKAGEKVKGTTIAELGNRNKPIDMIVYQKDGKDFILMANSSRGVMKITTENIDGIKPITQPIGGGGKAGLPYETIADLKGVEQLDRLGKDQAVILVRTKTGLNLDTIALP